jgi:hypothetical protein
MPSRRTAIASCVIWTLFTFVLTVTFFWGAPGGRTGFMEALMFGLLTILVNAVGTWVLLQRHSRE